MVAIFITIITFISPILGLFIILATIAVRYQKSKTLFPKGLCVAAGVIYGAFGYCMIPIGETDITRYYQMVERYYSGDLGYILRNETEFMYTRDVLFNFISKTKDVNTLAFIVGTIIYSIVFYVLADMMERVKINNRRALLIIILTLGIVPPYSTIGNVRCVLSYVVISFATYRDLVQHKKNLMTYALYILPIGLHTSAVIVLIVRLFQLLIKKTGKLVIALAVFLPTIINQANSLIGYLSNNSIGIILANAVSKAYYYLNWTEGDWATEVQKSLSNRVQRIYGAFFLILVIYIIFTSAINKGEHDNNIFRFKRCLIQEPMVAYLLCICACALGCLYITTGAFWRFEAIVVLFSSVILLPAMKYKTESIAYKLLFLSAPIMMVVSIAYMYRNLVASETTINFLFFNGIYIFGKVLITFL